MTQSKTREYDALSAIGSILGDFSPEDTYIGKAFEGCVEQAHENLSNDWMMSWKDRYDRASEKYNKAKGRVEDLNEKLRESEEARVKLVNELNQKDDAIARLEAMRDDYTGRASLEEAQRQISDLRQTILELKAKLYDMMTREEGEEE